MVQRDRADKGRYGAHTDATGGEYLISDSLTLAQAVYGKALFQLFGNERG